MGIWFTNTLNAKPGKWNTYREKKSGRIVRAYLRTEGNMDTIARELTNTNLHPFNVLMDSVKCGDYAVYGINPASHVYAVNAEKFDEIYEIMPEHVAY